MARNGKKIIRSILKALLVLALIVFSLFVLFIIVTLVLGKMENSEAMENAEAFCAAVKIGDDIKSHLSGIGRKGMYHWHDEGSGMHVIAFQGFIFDSARCQITVAGDTVKSKQVIMVHE